MEPGCGGAVGMGVEMRGAARRPAQPGPRGSPAGVRSAL